MVHIIVQFYFFFLKNTKYQTAKAIPATAAIITIMRTISPALLPVVPVDCDTEVSVIELPFSSNSCMPSTLLVVSGEDTAELSLAELSETVESAVLSGSD